MSKIDVEYDLDDALKSKGRVFVLFYASWCPFSQRFLPIFEKYAQENPQGCLRVKTDDKAKLCERYSVDVVPTVLLFEKGKVIKRLDGTPGAGLNEKQLKKLGQAR
jgi:thioredoxin 1